MFRPTIAVCCIFLTLAACHSSNRSRTSLSASASDTALLAPGATPKLVARQFSFTEGPAADKDGNVFFTDQPNNRIWKWTPSGDLSVFLEPAGRSNGMRFDRNGNLLSCADEQNQIWSISPDKKITVLLKEVDGKKLNGPNDLWVDKTGGIFFTDPFYKRPWWNHSEPQMPGQYLYYLPAGASQPRVADTAFKQPNGIMGTPDGRYLYVADIGAGKTYRYELAPGGELRNRTLFVPMGSDGMTLDQRGNLYLTGRGVTVFSPEGKKLTHIPIPEGWTANVAFGGRARNQLFVTAGTAVYTVDMAVRGAW